MSLTGAVVPPREEELTEKSQRTDRKGSRMFLARTIQQPGVRRSQWFGGEPRENGALDAKWRVFERKM